MKSKTTWLILGIALLAFWLGSRFGGDNQNRAVTNTNQQSSGTPVLVPTSSAGETDRTASPAWPQRDDNSRSNPADRSPTTSAYPDFLPQQAHDTLRLIERDGPFPHRQDGSTFQNRERHLPSQPRGYYREYTVKTPGSRDRGARRIVTGGRPPSEFYYTDDHYRSFTRFTLNTATQSRSDSP